MLHVCRRRLRNVLEQDGEAGGHHAPGRRYGSEGCSAWPWPPLHRADATSRGGARRRSWRPPRTGRAPVPEAVLGTGKHHGPEVVRSAKHLAQPGRDHGPKGSAIQAKLRALRECGVQAAATAPRGCSARTLAATEHRQAPRPRGAQRGRNPGPRGSAVCRRQPRLRGGARHGRWRPPRTRKAPRPRGGARHSPLAAVALGGGATSRGGARESRIRWVLASARPRPRR